METFLQKLSQFGTGPFLLVVAALLGWLVKKIDENNKKSEERINAMGASISAQMKDMEARFNERFATSEKRIEELANRVSGVERDYIPRDEHYKTFSGWRSELQSLQKLIIDLFKERK